MYDFTGTIDMVREESNGGSESPENKFGPGNADKDYFKKHDVVTFRVSYDSDVLGPDFLFDIESFSITALRLTDTASTKVLKAEQKRRRMVMGRSLTAWPAGGQIL